MSKVPREQLLEGHLNVLRKVASGVAHQSKSPLNSIAINAFILREKLSQFSEKKKDGERLFSCLASIDSDVRRLDSMLDVFFHFVRDDPKPESFSLSALAQECVDLLYHLATKHNCPLNISAGQEIEAFGNKSQVRRIIVSTALALLPTNSGLALELKGSGEKISVGLLAKAADPANPMTDPLLLLAAETTKQLHGEFRADSTDGGRHYFQISLPVSSEKPSDV